MKRGFTLIELMGVIVVLGVLAAISTIAVDKIIKENKQSVYEAQIASIEDGARAWAAKHIKEVPDENGAAISVPLLFLRNEGIISEDFENPKTNKPFNNDLYINISYEGGIYKYEVDETSGLGIDANPKLLNNKYVASAKTYSNGEAVYFNVTTGNKCPSSDYTEIQSNIGTKSGCMKFYAFNDDGGDTVNLFLDHNTTATIPWISKADYVEAGGTESDFGNFGKNDKGPLTVLKQLKNDTSSWQGTITPSNYTMNQTGQTSNAKYTIDYSGYKARLITAQELAQIAGNTSWDEKVAANSNWYYFDSKTDTESDTCKTGNTTGCSYGWLYDRTSTSCTYWGCLNNSDQETYGYWTASSHAATSSSAWYVHYYTVGNNNYVSYLGNFGVRPVITISKSQLQ